MKYLKYMINRQPLISVLVVIVLVAVVLFGFFILSVSLVKTPSLAQAGAMSLTGLILLLVLFRSGASSAAGISLSPGEWGRYWWTVSLLMSVLVLTSFLMDRVNVEALVFSYRHALEWILQNMATGFLEEVWFRGVCFYLLYRAWGSTRTGLFKAAATQALLFGLLHLANLHRSDLVHVLYQTGWATFIGFGFAGLTAYSRSIWPAITLHAFINAASNVDNFFAGPGYIYPEFSMSKLIIANVLFFIFAVLPGIWCLRRAPLK